MAPTTTTRKTIKAGSIILDTAGNAYYLLLEDMSCHDALYSYKQFKILCLPSMHKDFIGARSFVALSLFDAHYDLVNWKQHTVMPYKVLE